MAEHGCNGTMPVLVMACTSAHDNMTPTLATPENFHWSNVDTVKTIIPRQIFICMYWRLSTDVVRYARTLGWANSPMTQWLVQYAVTFVHHNDDNNACLPPEPRGCMNPEVLTFPDTAMSIVVAPPSPLAVALVPTVNEVSASSAQRISLTAAGRPRAAQYLEATDAKCSAMSKACLDGVNEGSYNASRNRPKAGCMSCAGEGTAWAGRQLKTRGSLSTTLEAPSLSTP
jgi:hypothetical protein